MVNFLITTLKNFATKNGIVDKFSCSNIPQKNSVIESKNYVLEKLPQTMIIGMSLPKYFWTDVVNTACQVLNMVVIKLMLDKISYDLLKDR